MNRKKVMLVFGTRPEAVKMAPLALALGRFSSMFLTRLVVTAQHREMLDGVLTQFGLHPDDDLNIMRPGQTLAEVSARVLSKLTPVLERESPDMVLVHGDTTTAWMAALAAFYQRIPVGHVEAGLRSGDVGNPFPEEMNRRGIAALAALHFAPTAGAQKNLIREGIVADRIFVTGNTGIDALRQVKARAFVRPPFQRFVLMTAHRRENFGEPLENIFGAVADVARARSEVGFVYPVHPNPQVLAPARRWLARAPNVHLSGPVDYGTMVAWMKKCLFVLTDSGGIQEEAPGLGKPVLVLRRVTERPEAVIAGTVKLVGTHRAEVRREIERLLDDVSERRRMALAVNPYGDGRAAGRITQALRHWFWGHPRPADFRSAGIKQGVGPTRLKSGGRHVREK